MERVDVILFNFIIYLLLMKQSIRKELKSKELYCDSFLLLIKREATKIKFHSLYS